MQCNVCASFGHTWLDCPKGNKEMQKKEIARQAERHARNASHAFRRAKEEVGGVAVVSEDEGDEGDDEEVAAGVNHKHCSVSLPHSLTLDTGYIIMFNGGAVSWKSRRQDCVSLSTSEAEYVVASQCGQEVYYMREILRDFGYAQSAPTHIYEDNLACVAMSENPVHRKFSRHIDITLLCP
jgi:hypothetical protein